MKPLLTALFGLLFSLHASAIETQIPLQCSKYEDQWTKDRRSLSTTLTATQDGNVLHIYTEWLMENCQITVTDANGQIVFTETTNLFPEQPYVFSVETIKESIYKLEITEGDNSYYGFYEAM